MILPLKNFHIQFKFELSENQVFGYEQEQMLQIEQGNSTETVLLSV